MRHYLVWVRMTVPAKPHVPAYEVTLDPPFRLSEANVATARRKAIRKARREFPEYTHPRTTAREEPNADTD